MMEPKHRTLSPEEEERMITPEALEEARKIVHQYSRVLKALAEH
jgi:hypothetical protein